MRPAAAAGREPLALPVWSLAQARSVMASFLDCSAAPPRARRVAPGIKTSVTRVQVPDVSRRARLSECKREPPFARSVRLPPWSSQLAPSGGAAPLRGDGFASSRAPSAAVARPSAASWRVACAYALDDLLGRWLFLGRSARRGRPGGGGRSVASGPGARCARAPTRMPARCAPPTCRRQPRVRVGTSEGATYDTPSMEMDHAGPIASAAVARQRLPLLAPRPGTMSWALDTRESPLRVRARLIVTPPARYACILPAPSRPAVCAAARASHTLECVRSTRPPLLRLSFARLVRCRLHAAPLARVVSLRRFRLRGELQAATSCTCVRRHAQRDAVPLTSRPHARLRRSEIVQRPRAQPTRC
mmetsp:Transcript_110631/g.356888  ORF Transcript_110631/g.356888 Transcript_110631/m.356888 type:complete len:360 (+) Transcript_110631:1923-3002(+)